MSTTQTMKHVGFTVPPPMEEELEQMAKEEHRTKSEMFREMVRFYRTYRKRFERVEDERFERMIDEVIAEAIKAQEEGSSLMTEKEAERAERELFRYGAGRAKKMRIKLEDVDRIIREHREKRKTTHRA
jgi:translation initiation factor 2B subunit (eIF-2B alpha/beta/delta family)